jgi:HEPN domain-containing protein
MIQRGIQRRDLQNLSRLRLAEAEALFAAGKYDGCVYRCGYVVELALKACICKCLDIETYPDSERLFKTHDFDMLELLAGLTVRREAQRRASAVFDYNWNLATGWKPEDRYLLDGNTEADAFAMLQALRSAPEGVLTWLSNQW